LGPFSQAGAPSAARNLQTFLIIAGMPLALLAASLTELEDKKRLALRSIERLNLALEAARMGTWHWDMQHDALTWTGTGPGAPGRGRRIRSTSIGRLLKQVPSEDRQRLTRALSATGDGGGTAEVEFRVRRPNGDLRWISTTGKFVVDHGAPRMMMGVYGDATSRKNQEARYVRQREEIARLNRVAMLHALSGTLAHELGQPLTAILANAEAGAMLLGRDSHSAAEIKAVLNDITADCDRIIHVTRRLNTLLERARPPAQPVDANECIHSVLELERDYLAAYDVTAGTRLEKRLPTLTIGAVQLQQVLTHLILNACEAMVPVPARDRRLEIVSRRRADDGVHIVVTDGGMGIQDTEVIFEPFFTTKDYGIGLGLAVCRTIVASHGGRLWATNNTPRGASLHVSLPAANWR
jgi:C4-dicarboxylate-specific signal transduction histidine kinase